MFSFRKSAFNTGADDNVVPHKFGIGLGGKPDKSFTLNHPELCTIVEVMTPVFHAAAWEVVHAMLASVWPERMLNASSHLLNDMWCTFLLKHGWQRPCIVSRTARILHADTKMIEFQAGHRNRSDIAVERRRGQPMARADFRRLVAPYYMTFNQRQHYTPTCLSQRAVVCAK